MRTVNITTGASGDGLRKELDDHAQRLGVPLRRLVAAIYMYAVDNQDDFTGPLKDVKRPPGQHIGTEVTDMVCDKLTAWAKERGAPRGIHCKYILEKALEKKLPEKVLSFKRG